DPHHPCDAGQPLRHARQKGRGIHGRPRLPRALRDCKPPTLVRPPAVFFFAAGVHDRRIAMTRWWILIGLACGALSCSTVPRPVPVAGTPLALRELAGQWSGDYHANGGG